MLTTLDKNTIQIFLNICHKEISNGNCQLINRVLTINDKKITTKQSLLNIGITKKEQIWNHILTLEEKNCIKIDFDHDRKRDTNSEIYIFKKNINKKDVYIKLTIRKVGIVCISFHESY